MVWECIPKEVFVGAGLLEFGLFDAVNHFSTGARTVLLLLKALKISPGKYTEEACGCLDLDRIRGAEYCLLGDNDKKRRQKPTSRGCQLCCWSILRHLLCSEIEQRVLKPKYNF